MKGLLIILALCAVVYGTAMGAANECKTTESRIAALEVRVQTLEEWAQRRGAKD